MQVLFRLYFCEVRIKCGCTDQLLFLDGTGLQNKCLGHREVLLGAAREAGVTGAEEVVDNSCRMMPELQQEMQTVGRNWLEMLAPDHIIIGQGKGITGVPNITIGDSIVLSGAQPPDVLVSTIAVSNT